MDGKAGASQAPMDVDAQLEALAVEFAVSQGFQRSTGETGGDMRVNVKFIDRESASFVCSSRLTVKQAKRKVERNEDEAALRFIYKGKVLKDELTLLQCGFKDGDTIHAVVEKSQPSGSTASEPERTEAREAQAAEFMASLLLREVSQVVERRRHSRETDESVSREDASTPSSILGMPGGGPGPNIQPIHLVFLNVQDDESGEDEPNEASSDEDESSEAFSEAESDAESEDEESGDTESEASTSSELDVFSPMNGESVPGPPESPETTTTSSAPSTYAGNSSSATACAIHEIQEQTPSIHQSLQQLENIKLPPPSSCCAQIMHDVGVAAADISDAMLVAHSELAGVSSQLLNAPALSHGDHELLRARMHAVNPMLRNIADLLGSIDVLMVNYTREVEADADGIEMKNPPTPTASSSPVQQRRSTNHISGTRASNPGIARQVHTNDNQYGPSQSGSSVAFAGRADKTPHGASLQDDMSATPLSNLIREALIAHEACVSHSLTTFFVHANLHFRSLFSTNLSQDVREQRRQEWRSSAIEEIVDALVLPCQITSSFDSIDKLQSTWMKNAIDAFINESLNFKLDTMMVTGVVPSSIAGAWGSIWSVVGAFLAEYHGSVAPSIVVLRTLEVMLRGTPNEFRLVKREFMELTLLLAMTRRP